MALILAITLSHGKASESPDRLWAFLCIWILDVCLFFQMIRSGKTDRYRAVLFVLFAVALSLTFMVRMMEARGHISFQEADLLQCNIPFCHIVTTMVLIPIVFSKAIIFPGNIEGSYASIASMLVIVAGALIILGRGFCAWGCFFGGWDDGCSRLLKTARWRRIPTSLRWGGFAMLILVALSSAAALSPTYCAWVCPFKAVTESGTITNAEGVMKTILFGSLFVGLVIILPILTKKRTQCAWFCPMGALCSLMRPVNIHEIRIDHSRCINCHKCIEACPVQALDADALNNGRAQIQCVKCGKCVDVCPKHCIGYHIRFTQILKHPETARILFLYAGFGFLAIFSGGTLQQALLLLLRIVATGKILS
jgi:polyferredoxin